MSEKARKLRRGFTTGSCVAAGAIAAYQALSGKMPSRVSLYLLNGETVSIPVTTGPDNFISVKKDAGDDPDVTDKAVIRTRLTFCSAEAAEKHDYIEPCGKSQIIIRGKSGVGLVTRPGLEVPVGKWAINPGPRRMLAENLLHAGFGEQKGETLLIEIEVANGEKIARRTLNPTLGVTGGISILGTTGIVEPYSNAAYIHTIKIHIKAAAAQGFDTVALTTGSRTMKNISRDLPDIQDDNCIRIGDFIADSLEAAAEDPSIKNAVIACMPGKVYKYACAHRITHAHKNRLEPGLMVKVLRKLGVAPATIEAVKKCDTVGEAMSKLTQDENTFLLHNLADIAYDNLRKWAPGVNIIIMLYNTAGNLILRKGTTSE
ncbi:cobalt-precorrin-5B (C(1))-methyltransferase CbiD [Lentisphaerota bacterium ZTH]|nr:cobalt-precorrin-5B (C(1))-methyltransferase [Lentisphaerota bacterium]WET07545.1 cobalt-precorrin-5B (C(1))-methyltransferase CbiD [Lentisphaerota bacterium ZTH]